jgi:hypothetical protein
VREPLLSTLPMTAPRCALTFTDLAEDDCSVMRERLLPGDADVRLQLAAHDAASRVLRGIMDAKRRPALPHGAR